MGVAQTAFVLRKSASSPQFQLRLKHLCPRTLSGVEAGKLLQRCMAHTGNHSRLPHININRTHMPLLHRASRAILCPARQRPLLRHTTLPRHRKPNRTTLHNHPAALRRRARIPMTRVAPRRPRTRKVLRVRRGQLLTRLSPPTVLSVHFRFVPKGGLHLLQRHSQAADRACVSLTL